MTPDPSPAGTLLLLPDAAVAQAAMTRLRGLDPSPALHRGPASFTILDNFDREVLGGNRLLLMAEGWLDCIGGAGSSARQKAGTAPAFPDRIAAGPVRSALHDVSALRRLDAVAGGTLQGDVFHLVDDAQKTRVRLALWQLDGDAGPRLVLAQVQGLRGYDKAARALHEALLTLGAAPIDAAAAFRILFPAAPDAPDDGALRFSRSEPAIDVARAIICAQLAILRRNEKGIIEDIDTEFLHDYRVALRRIRSVTSLFRGVIAEPRATALKARFSKMMRPTGPLRDLDVRALEAARFHAMIPSALHPGLDAMQALAADERAGAQLALARHLRSPAHRRDMERLEALFATPGKLKAGPDGRKPIGALARDLVLRRHKRFERLARGIGPDTPDEAVHALRIEGKKLRYLLELLAPLFRRDTLASILRPLKQIQDILGRFNDASVQRADTAGFLAGLEPGTRPGALGMAAAAGALQSALESRQATEREALTQALATVDHDAMRNKLHRLFCEGSPSR